MRIPMAPIAGNVALSSSPDMVVCAGAGLGRHGRRLLQREHHGLRLDVLARARELRVVRVVVRHVAGPPATGGEGGRFDGGGAEVEGPGALVLGADTDVSWEMLVLRRRVEEAGGREQLGAKGNRRRPTCAAATVRHDVVCAVGGLEVWHMFYVNDAKAVFQGLGLL
jgi:hypothetical protein